MIPVTIVTGFLGSGKTTLIAEILRQPGFEGTLVVVNEFGEVGIDHDLLESSSEDTILLANGCLCCTIRGNLVDTLDSAIQQREQGRLRAFDRVVVETSGLADPAPFLGFLYQEAAFHERFSVAGVVTLVDAASPDTLARFPEAASQVRMADRVILSKTDLASAQAIAALEQEIRALNPDADLRHAVRGQIEPAAIFDLHRAMPQIHGHRHQHHHHHHHEHDDAEAVARRHHGISRCAVTLPPLDPAALGRVLAVLRGAMGPHLLRAKGLLRLTGDARIALIQGTLTALAPPEYLPLAIEGEGRLVLLLQNDDGAALEAALLAAAQKPT